MSQTARNSVNEWFHTTLASRPNDKKRDAILLAMQRLHQNDLAGMRLESGEWHELSISAIATDNEIIPLTRGRFHRRNLGEVLNPAHGPREELLRIKESIGSIIFAARYQQQPVPAEGNLVNSEWSATMANRQPLVLSSRAGTRRRRPASTATSRSGYGALPQAPLPYPRRVPRARGLRAAAGKDHAVLPALRGQTPASRGRRNQHAADSNLAASSAARRAAADRV